MSHWQVLNQFVMDVHHVLVCCYVVVCSTKINNLYIHALCTLQINGCNYCVPRFVVRDQGKPDVMLAAPLTYATKCAIIDVVPLPLGLSLGTDTPR